MRHTRRGGLAARPNIVPPAVRGARSIAHREPLAIQCAAPREKAKGDAAAPPIDEPLAAREPPTP